MSDILIEAETRLNEIKADIEATTGEKYKTVNDGVQELKKGYGQGEIPTNAKFHIVKYTEDGYPLEVNLCSEGDTAVGTYAFNSSEAYLSPYWRKIEKVNIPSTVTEIGARGLSGLTSLKEVSIWDNIEKAGLHSFNSTGIPYNYLPPKLITIERGAFAKCHNLAITELPNGVTTIDNSAFTQSYNKVNIKKLPPNLISVGNDAFSNNGFACVSFSEIPASVQTIGINAFKGACLGIVGSLTFKGTPTSIATNAFALGKKVTDVYVPWAEGEVANAPWGMTKATIHYNSEV